MSGTITMTGEEYDAMAGELDRVSRELSCLQSVIAEPDELNAEPASDYETLRRQYLSLRLLTNSALARNRYLCMRDDRDMRAALSVNAANISAERDTNAMLTDLLEKAEAERDALHAEAEVLDTLCQSRFDEIAQLKAEAEALRAENAKLRAELAESQVNDRTAMGYLSDVRQIVGGGDFPAMVANVARMAGALCELLDLVETISPFEGSTIRKARAAIAQQGEGEKS